MASSPAPDAVLVVVLHVDVESAVVAQRVNKGVDRSVARAGQHRFGAVDHQMGA